jgi:DNA-binding response OmpR family regulator
MNKVLIVEDDLTIARIYHGLIRTQGWEPSVAGDGDMAIETLAKFRPDLVLLDLMLPKKNGVEVIKHIRSTPELHDVPVLVLTNACMSTLVQEAVQAGATECLIKAKTAPRQLMEVLRGFLKSAARSAPAQTAGAPSSAAKQPRPSDVATGDAPTPERPLPCPPAAPLAPALIASAENSIVRPNSLKVWPGMLNDLRRGLEALARAVDDKARRSHLEDLGRITQELASSLESAGSQLGQMASAFQALLRGLLANTSRLNPSSIRTVAQALDCLDASCSRLASGELTANGQPAVLVLDDDAISQRLICSSLERANFDMTVMQDPNTALELLNAKPFAVVFLNASTAGLEGAEFEGHLRAAQSNQGTPCVFVVASWDVERRALLILSSGHDFIGKPFLQAELLTKTWCHILKPRRTPGTKPGALAACRTALDRPSPR